MFEKIKEKLPITIPIIAYLIVSWAVIQVASVCATHFGFPQWVFVAAVIVLALGFPFVLAFSIRIYLFKPLYIDSQIEGVRSATKNIFMAIHSLMPANKKHPKLVLLNEALKNAKERGVIVKILAPGGVDRAEGAYIIHEIYGLDIRFANQLQDQDLRYMIIDNNISIISYQKSPAPVTKPSRKFATIKSERLNKLLTNDFNDIWNSEKTFNFELYIKDLLSSLNAMGREPLQRCSDVLRIPTHILERVRISCSNLE